MTNAAAETFSVEHRDRFDALLASSDHAPVAIVNLLKYRTTALYPAECEEARMGLSGKDAYRTYMTAAAPILAKWGGATLLFADELQYLVGSGDWDAIWVNRYPNPAALASMVADPTLAAHLHHRDAALERQHNMACRPIDGLRQGSGLAI